MKNLVEGPEGDVIRTDRLKFLWHEDSMKELLEKIRGQQGALNLLLTTLQMWVMVVLHKRVPGIGANIPIGSPMPRSFICYATNVVFLQV